tara:strand:- start:193 stop:888 length:696 start_codon:yes stop_codon:yes gene_type:complete
MKTDMKIIMENWRSHVVLTEQQLLQEQLLLEGFLDSLKKLSGNIKEMFAVISKILKDPNKISNFVALLDDKVITPSIDKIKNLFQTIKEKFSTEEANNSFIGGMIKTVNEYVSKSYNFVNRIEQDTWKKAVSSIGLAVVLNFLTDKLLQIPIDLGIDKVVGYFNDDILNFLKKFLGEALIETLSSAMSGGVSTFVSVIAKIVGGTSFIAQTISPAVEKFQAGGLTLTKFEQ